MSGGGKVILSKLKKPKQLNPSGEGFRSSGLTSVGHRRFDDVQRGVILTEVVGHIPVRVDSQQVCAAAARKQT